MGLGHERNGDAAVPAEVNAQAECSGADVMKLQLMGPRSGKVATYGGWKLQLMGAAVQSCPRGGSCSLWGTPHEWIAPDEPPLFALRHWPQVLLSQQRCEWDEVICVEDVGSSTELAASAEHNEPVI